MFALLQRNVVGRLVVVLGFALALGGTGLLWGAEEPRLTDPEGVRNTAIREAVQALVESIPEKTPEPVGLVPLKGDDEGRVTNALATALTEGRPFALAQLSALGPEANPAQLTAAARKAGVAALLTGEVQENKVVAGSARVVVTARLTNVDDGKELWTGRGEGERINALGAALSVETIVERTLDQEGLMAAAQEKVCRRLVSSFGSALPAKVGLMPILGDTDGQLRRRLAAALTDKVEVVMVEAESPTLDSVEAARLGREAGVEAVIVGQVEGMKVLLGRADVTLHGRLIRSRDGVIVKAATFRQIYQSHVGRYRWVMVTGIAVMIILLGLIVGPRLARRIRRMVPGQARVLRERELSRDNRSRERLSREITACLDLLKDMADRATTANQSQRHTLIQRLRRGLDVFRLEIESAPYGHHPELARAGVNERDLRHLEEIEQRVLGMLAGMHEELKRLREDASGEHTDQQLGVLHRQVQDVTAVFSERKSILSGIRR